MSTVTQVAGIVNRDNAAEVFKRTAGKSQREVAGVVAEYKPEAALPERAVPVCLKKTCSDGGKEYVHKVKLESSVSPESFRKLEMIQLLLSNKYPQGATLEQAFDEILEDYYERQAPERKAARRLAREARKGAPTDKPGKRKVHKISRNRSGCRLRKASPPQRKSVQAKRAKRQHRSTPAISLLRSRKLSLPVTGGCCSYVGKDGKRCNSRWGLQYDHIEGFARGAGNEPEELRLLCAKHNQLEAFRMYGAAVMQKFRRRQ